jgi:hypothetical protein
LERLQANAHEFRELRLLSSLRTAGSSLTDELAVEAERLIGGAGTDAYLRLGLEPEATPEEITARARECLRRWRLVSESPLTDRPGQDVCRVVIRSCEGVLAECAALQLY